MYDYFVSLVDVLAVEHPSAPSWEFCSISRKIELHELLLRIISAIVPRGDATALVEAQ